MRRLLRCVVVERPRFLCFIPGLFACLILSLFRDGPWMRGTDKCLYFPRWQFSVPRCNAHRAERQMGKRDEAHDTVATASRDRKGVFKWVSMKCTFLQLVQIQP
jgi:hypothetical protein